MRAWVDAKGTVYLIYRGAKGGVDRDMWLLASDDRGERFGGSLVQKWNIGNCPMSSESFAEGAGKLFAAWETQGQVYYAQVEPGTSKVSRPVAAAGTGKDRKHPALAVNKNGELLFVWTEGTGWKRGGNLAWYVYDRKGETTGVGGRVAGGIPVWGLPTCVARPDGSFLIIH
jgi:hypothetical protein